MRFLCAEYPVMHSRLLLFLFPLLCSVLRADGADREAAKQFETTIRPLLAERCFACHGAEKQKAGLRLDRRGNAFRGGKSGSAFVPGDPDSSLLVEAIRRADPEFSMPPEEPLSAEEVARLENWIREGAFWPGQPDSPSESISDAHGFTGEDRDWWAIQPVTEPEVPRAGEGWAKNGIDRFIARSLQRAGLAPAPEADPREFIRRLYFDLHGLPPTPAEVDAFVKTARRDYDHAVGEEIDRQATGAPPLR